MVDVTNGDIIGIASALPRPEPFRARHQPHRLQASPRTITARWPTRQSRGPIRRVDLQDGHGAGRVGGGVVTPETRYLSRLHRIRRTTLPLLETWRPRHRPAGAQPGGKLRRLLLRCRAEGRYRQDRRHGPLPGLGHKFRPADVRRTTASCPTRPDAGTLQAGLADRRHQRLIGQGYVLASAFIAGGDDGARRLASP